MPAKSYAKITAKAACHSQQHVCPVVTTRRCVPWLPQHISTINHQRAL